MDTERAMTLQQFKESSLNRRTLLKASAGATTMLVVHSAFALDALAQAENDPLLTGLQFFTPQQAETVSAIAERIWPATDASPGAREAGVVYYIDHALAGEYEQYKLDYRIGLGLLDDVARQRHDAPFRNLSAEQQDALLTASEAGELERIERAQEQQGLEDPAPAARPARLATEVGIVGREIAGLTEPEGVSLQSFFDLVYAHTMEGLFSDPIYGGNRDFAGWRAVGYPGAYYVYTEEEQQSFEPLDKPFQSIADI